MQRTFAVITVVFFLACSAILSQSQDKKEDKYAFFFDAVCFQSEKDSLSRIDIIAFIPYQTLHFEKNQELFGARYDASIKLFDSSENKIEEKQFNNYVTEKDYKVTLGSTAKFDYIQHSFYVPKGKYQIEISLSDGFTKRLYIKARNISVINFRDYPFSLSGIMLLSSIEENNGKFLITPHITDNIGEMSDGFFVFYEIYNRHSQQPVDFVYEIVSEDGIIIKKSPRVRKTADSAISRQYLKISLPNELKKGIYNLRLIALKPSASPDYTTADYIAIAERSIQNNRISAGYAIEDLDKAIKQLRYVATQTDMDFINEGSSPEEKQKRFDDFWKNLDPTPNTERNEAFEEYFARIEFANASFKSYTDGWLSDMGQTYIVYGKPDQRENLNYYSDTRKYEKWTYFSNRDFVFVDNSGFGDFRLAQPMSITEKYRYKR